MRSLLTFIWTMLGGAAVALLVHWLFPSLGFVAGAVTGLAYLLIASCLINTLQTYGSEG